MDTAHEFTNRLAGEKSPYLQQHAHNPVDWYPWGEEALERARSEDKPIFLSVGYSTCHWCHVMERESFENEEIAAVLNENFVSIKVDREERPDIDNLYMTAVQGLTGRGGWPMSVFLTPDGKPFFGGTYFPPEDRMGMLGFRTILQNIAVAWKDDREALVEQGDKVAEFLKAQSEGEGAGKVDLSQDLLDGAYRAVARNYDAVLGGFGSAPKFPTPHKLTFLLRYAERTGSKEAGDMVRGTLEAMAAGGIQDHLGGGFHRYSTDSRWLAPHFEKMLYDQASLTLAYTAAWQMFRDDSYAVVTRGILDYVLRDLCDAGGGFYSAEDADSEGEEGTFYVWSASEIDSVLGLERGAGFRAAYGVVETGNWEGKNILHQEHHDPEATEKWSREREELWALREKRPRPHRDDKIIAGWNGFMIEAMSGAGAAFNEPRYIEAAVRAARFVDENLWQGDRLLRHHTGGAANVPGYLDDYAYLGRGYLALYEATFDPEWLEKAARLAADLDRLFARPGGGYNLSGSDGEELLVPVVETYDGAIPSGNSVAALFLLRLGHLTANNDVKEKGWKVLQAFSESMAKNPEAHLEMLSALDFALGPNTEVVVAGDSKDPKVEAMCRVLRERYLPNAVIAFRPNQNFSRVVKLISYLEDQTALGGQPTAYVCKDYACRLPVHDSDALVRQLQEN